MVPAGVFCWSNYPDCQTTMGHRHMLNTPQIVETDNDQGWNYAEQPYLPIGIMFLHLNVLMTFYSMQK